MQIILINRLITFFFACLLLTSNVYADSFPKKALDLTLNNGSNIGINISNNRINAKIINRKNKISIKINADLASHLLSADEAYLLLKVPSKNRDLFVILSREPSTKIRSTGFCGAGYEDFILLVESTKKQIALKDKFLVQSCNKSILLDSDKGDDPLQAISIEKIKPSFSFRWLGDVDGQQRNITIDDSHFIMR